MRGSWEPTHVRADLGQDHLSGALAHPWDRHQQLQQGRERGGHAGHLRAQAPDRLVQLVDAGQHLGDQQPMMGSKATLQGLPQCRQLGPQPPPSQLGQHLGIMGALNQCLQHRPA